MISLIWHSIIAEIDRINAGYFILPKHKHSFCKWSWHIEQNSLSTTQFQIIIGLIMFLVFCVIKIFPDVSRFLPLNMRIKFDILFVTILMNGKIEASDVIDVTMWKTQMLLSMDNLKSTLTSVESYTNTNIYEQIRYGEWTTNVHCKWKRLAEQKKWNKFRTKMHVFSFRNSFSLSFLFVLPSIIFVFISFSFFSSLSFSFSLTKFNRFR